MEQAIYTKGNRQRTQARNLIKSATPSSEALEQTIEMRSSEDVVCKVGRYGATYYVRSSFSAIRYYPVVWNAERTAWHCTCYQQCETHKHTRAINAFIQAQKVVA